jgi:hypothetical protein
MKLTRYSEADVRRINGVLDQAEEAMAGYTDENLIGIAKCIVRFSGVEVTRTIKAIKTRREAAAVIVEAARPQVFFPSRRPGRMVIGGAR